MGIIGLNTIFSLYYYARVVKVMYLKDSDAPVVRANPLGVGLAMASAAMLVVLFVGWGPLDRMTTNYGRMFLSSAPNGQTAQVAQAR